MGLFKNMLKAASRAAGHEVKKSVKKTIRKISPADNPKNSFMEYRPAKRKSTTRRKTK